ncbi:hypothetical protein GCM10028825_35800 [Spirosoma agri]
MEKVFDGVIKSQVGRNCLIFGTPWLAKVTTHYRIAMAERDPNYFFHRPN